MTGMTAIALAFALEHVGVKNVPVYIVGTIYFVFSFYKCIL